MIVKNVNVSRFINYYRFQFTAINIHDATIFRIERCTTSFSNYTTRHYHLNHKNDLTQKMKEINCMPVQILRYKGTESTTATPTPKENIVVEETSEKPLTRGEKLKKAVKEYGATVIVFHVTISLISLGTCYLAVSSGLDITKVLAVLGLEDKISKNEMLANAGTLAVAYAIHKMFVPVRMTITMASVPLIVKYLRSIGFMKK